MACTLAESLNDPLYRKLRQLCCLRCRFDCYRVERTSSRAGVAPAEAQRLSRRTFSPIIFRISYTLGQEFPVRMTPERRKAVLADLNHRSMLTANDASRAISQDSDPALLPGLVWALRHGHRTHNRVEAAYALGFMKGTKGTAALESTL